MNSLALCVVLVLASKNWQDWYCPEAIPALNQYLPGRDLRVIPASYQYLPGSDLRSYQLNTRPDSISISDIYLLHTSQKSALDPNIRTGMKVLRKSHTHNRLVYIYIYTSTSRLVWNLWKRSDTISSWYVLKLIPTQVPTLVSTD
jgi:hypothetical protein